MQNTFVEDVDFKFIRRQNALVEDQARYYDAEECYNLTEECAKELILISDGPRAKRIRLWYIQSLKLKDNIHRRHGQELVNLYPSVSSTPESLLTPTANLSDLNLIYRSPEDVLNSSYPMKDDSKMSTPVSCQPHSSAIDEDNSVFEQLKHEEPLVLWDETPFSEPTKEDEPTTGSWPFFTQAKQDDKIPGAVFFD